MPCHQCWQCNQREGLRRVTNGQEDFGRYLQSVAERDIDLLLMEEFHVDPEFAKWFACLVGLGDHSTFDGAWHSLNDRDGETDLLLRVRCVDQRVAILIENKIAAPEQSEQDLRYHLRGQRAQEAGRYERFVTSICAPKIYLDGLPDSSLYEHRIPYEAIRDWYAGKTGPRARWREAIIIEAIEQGRRGYTMKVHGGISAFHLAFWQILQERHPELIMRRPTAKGPGSTWIYLRTADFPKGVSLIFKSDQGCVDLQFENTRAGDLQSLRQSNWPDQCRIAQKGKSAAVSMPVPACDFTKPLADQSAAVADVVATALRLSHLASIRTLPA